MLKVNSYSLFFLAALFLDSPNVLCSSPTQCGSHNNFNNPHPHTNPSSFVSYMPNNNTNFDSLLNGFPPLNASYTQQEVTHSATMGFPRELSKLFCTWNFNGTINALFGTNNNTALPPPLPNVADTSTNISSVGNPMPPLENTDSTITVFANADTNNKNKPLLIPKRAAPYQCHLCDKSFTEKSGLEIHIKRHNKVKPFLCDFFPKDFTINYEKVRHHRTHTEERPFKCLLCNQCFATQNNLHHHHRTHRGEKPYKCLICQKRLSSKRILENHLNKHKGIKPYSCEECQKSFRKKSRLKEHRKLHKEEKPYKCDQCPKAYTTREGLKYHIKTHNRPKPYSCRYCGTSFAHKSKYEDHIRYEEETDDDRKCHICKKVYSDRYNLIKHNKRAHPRINS